MAFDIQKFIKGLAIQNDTDKTKQLVLDVPNTIASGAKTILAPNPTVPTNTIITVTLPVTTSTLITDNSVSILTNKTFDADGTGNVLTNIDDGNIKIAAGIDVTKIGSGDVSNAEFDYLKNVTSDIQQQFTDANTNKADIDLSNLTTTAINVSSLTFNNASAVNTVGTTNATGTNTKAVRVKSGDATSSNSGNISFLSGSGNSTGQVSVLSGAAGAGTSGLVAISSGSATINTGNITLTTGNSSGGNSGSVNIIAGTATGTRGDITLDASATQIKSNSILKFNDLDNTNFIGLKSPSVVASDVTFILPGTDGTSGQVLNTDGAGNLGWTSSAALTRVVSTKTSNYTLLTSDSIILADTTSGDLTLTLPSVVSASGRTFTVKRKTSDVNILKVTSASNIDGATDSFIDNQYDFISYFSDGTTYWTL